MNWEKQTILKIFLCLIVSKFLKSLEVWFKYFQNFILEIDHYHIIP